MRSTCWLAASALLAGACSTDTFGGSADGSAGDGGLDGVPTDVMTSDGADTCGPSLVCGSGQFCTSFDTVSNVGSPYDPFVSAAQGSGTVEVSTDHHVTCPASFLSTLDPVSGTGSRATIGYSTGANVNTLPHHASLELDVILPANVSGTVSLFALSTNITQASVGLGSAPSGWFLFGEAASTIQALPTPPRVGHWNHMRLDVTFSADGNVGGATLSYETDALGRQMVSFKDRTLPGGTVAIASVAAEVGLDTNTTTTAKLVAYYDNVVFQPF